MIDITMPKPGQTVEQGLIVGWRKAEGDSVAAGEILAEIETDKAVFELESPGAGVLLKIIRPEGASAPVHSLIALLGEPGEDVAAHLAARPPDPPPTEDAPAPASAPAAPSPANVSAPSAASRTPPPGGTIRASPAAKKLAKERGVNLAAVGAGSGPGGLITSEDVARFSAVRASAPTPARAAPSVAGPVPEGAVRKPLSRMRKAIAANLTLSRQTIPDFTMDLTVDAVPVEAYYASVRGRMKVGRNDILLAAAARAMRDFPEFRSRFEGETVLEFARANVGIAVAVEGGLVVPVVVGADEMPLAQLAAEAKRVVEAARAGRMEGAGKATLTLTNLGMFGVKTFSAIINPPDAAILAAGATRDAAVVRDGAVVPGRVLTFTLVSDHRLIDGVVAAKFLARFREILEKPEILEAAL
ncbi:MAG: dihydrolipoamide acetyltransferase family protein [Planctomycetota bacterium]